MNIINRPIGLLDSGVGGLTVVRELMKEAVSERIVYFGDTLHLPYGPRSRTEVEGFVFKIIEYLIESKLARAIVLACNTATAFTLEKAQKRYPTPIFGTLSGACQRAIELTNNGKIGVIGTQGTIESRAYQRIILEYNPELQVFGRACPRFVELVEEGQLEGKEIEEAIHYYLDDLRDSKGIDVLILGCTHYPYLMPVIRRIMGKEVTLINPAVEVVAEISRTLAWQKQAAASKQLKRHEFLVSDRRRISQRFLEQGRHFLNLPELNFIEDNIFA